jgi:hypothetical protein
MLEYALIVVKNFSNCPLLFLFFAAQISISFAFRCNCYKYEIVLTSIFWGEQMEKSKLRKLRGIPLICRRLGPKIVGENKGKKIKKSVRPNVLKDVQKIWDETIRKIKREVREELGEKYHYRRDNPFEDWYVDYLVERYYIEKINNM